MTREDQVDRIARLLCLVQELEAQQYVIKLKELLINRNRTTEELLRAMEENIPKDPAPSSGTKASYSSVLIILISIYLWVAPI